MVRLVAAPLLARGKESSRAVVDIWSGSGARRHDAGTALATLRAKRLHEGAIELA
jgi:hypothetical protein